LYGRSALPDRQFYQNGNGRLRRLSDMPQSLCGQHLCLKVTALQGVDEPGHRSSARMLPIDKTKQRQ
jgi:hypothetical protein